MQSSENFPRVSAPKQIADQSKQGVQNLQYDNILQQSFVYMLVGKPGCGKSHLISEMILRQDFYCKQFNKVIYISPSRVHPDIECDDQFSCRSLQQEHIMSVIQRLSSVTSKHPQKQYNFLFVLDDCVGALQDIGKNSVITNLFFNRRHIIPNSNVSIILTTQQFKAISAQLRAVVTGLFLFTPSPRQLDCLKQQYVFDQQMHVKAVQIIQQYFTQELFQFLYIKTHPRVELYYNFLKVY